MSIQSQIADLVWLDAGFHMVLEARRRRLVEDETNPRFNSIIMQMIDVGYVDSQVMRIRRLAEPAKKRKDRGRTSLRTIIDEMEQARHYEMRENFVCADGSPYEPRVPDFPTTGAARWAGDWGQARRRHDVFDRLSGITKGPRNRSDLIHPAVFNILRSRIDTACRPVRRQNILDKDRSSLRDSFWFLPMRPFGPGTPSSFVPLFFA